MTPIWEGFTHILDTSQSNLVSVQKKYFHKIFREGLRLDWGGKGVISMFFFLHFSGHSEYFFFVFFW